MNTAPTRSQVDRYRLRRARAIEWLGKRYLLAEPIKKPAPISWLLRKQAG